MQNDRGHASQKQKRGGCILVINVFVVGYVFYELFVKFMGLEIMGVLFDRE
ncbi:Uncharacterised protein [Serratia proteamaculans]|nr:Uncharacterised protein [Serratia proteamaculans]